MKLTRWFAPILCIFLLFSQAGLAQKKITLGSGGPPAAGKKSLRSGGPATANRKRLFRIITVPGSDSTYTLAEPTAVSMGVYDGQTLIRTLLSSEQKPAGTYLVANVWDGLKDDGTEAPNGSYTIRARTNRVQYDWLGVIGNTSTNTIGPNRHDWFDRVWNMCVVNDFAWLTLGYTEGSVEEKILDATDPNIETPVWTSIPADRDEDGFSSRDVCSDGTRVYYAGIDPNVGNISGIYAFNVSDRSEYIFSSGTPYKSYYGRQYASLADHGFENIAYSSSVSIPYSLLKPNKYITLTGNITVTITGSVAGNSGVLTLTKTSGSENITLAGTLIGTHSYPTNAGGKVFLSWKNVGGAVQWTESDDGKAANGLVGTDLRTPSGMAVQKSGNYLFLARKFMNSIRVSNKLTGAFVVENTLDSARYMSIDGADNLWVISGQKSVARYTVNANGTLTPSGMTIPGLIKPISVNVSPDGSTVVVGDAGSSMQYKAFSTSTGAAVWTFGQAGGYANSPDVADNKLWFQSAKSFNKTADYEDVAFCAWRSDGSIWFADMGNQRLLLVSADRTTKLNEVICLGAHYIVQADPNDPSRVFANYHEYKIDYSKANANTPGFWKLWRNWGGNIDLTQTGDDQYFRLKFPTTLPNGRTYACVRTPGSTNKLEIVELTSTGLRYTDVVTDDLKVGFEANGDLTSISSTGIGQAVTWKRKVRTGFDGSGNPTYGAWTTTASVPAITTKDPLSNSGNMYRGQTTTSNIIVSMAEEIYKQSDLRGNGYHLGGVAVGGTDWLWKVWPSTTKQYSGPYPKAYYDIGNYGPVAGNGASYMTTVDRNIFTMTRGEFWKGSQTRMSEHYYDDGLHIGQYGTTGPIAEAISRRAGPMAAGNILNGTFVKVNGDYYEFHNDEFSHSAAHVWKISNLASIEEKNFPIIKTGTLTVPPPPYLEPFSTLPYNGSVVNGVGGWTRSPAADYTTASDDLLSSGTSRQSYKTDERDLYVKYISQDASTVISFEKGLGAGSGLTSWTFTCGLVYPQLSEPSGTNYLQLKDAAGRVIVQISRPEVAGGGINIKANNTTIVQATSQVLKPTISVPRPLIIVRSGSNLIVTYHNYDPVTITVLDGLASIANPQSLRIEMSASPDNQHQIDVVNPRFYTP